MTFALVAALLALGLALLAAELGLRLFDVRPGRVNPGYLQFGYPDGIPTLDEDGVAGENQRSRYPLFGPDPELFWKALPDTEFTNGQGFRAELDTRERKPEGTIRILFIGDSCVFLGKPVYPEIVEQRLGERLAGRRVEAINASVPGYTSFQGRKLIGRLERYQPDYVAVSFGWNDHWPAQGGLSDAEQWAVGNGPRLLGLWHAYRAKLRETPQSRVSLAEFEANLDAIRTTVESFGAVPVFLTAPTGFVEGALPDWAFRYFPKNYGMDEAAVRGIPAQHEAYVNAVRRVGARGRALLVDAAAGLRASGADPGTLFRTDQIHLRTAGHEQVADLVVEALTARIAERPQD